MTRARTNRIVVALNSIAGKVVDMNSIGDGRALVYDQTTDEYKHMELPEAGGILEYPTLSAFPATGTPGYIYFSQDNNRSYRWDEATSDYVEYKNPGTFADIAEKPTTIGGYGITNAYEKIQIGDPAMDYIPFFENAML